MRLSKGHERQLTQLIWRERLRRGGLIALAVLVVGVGAVYLNYERQLRADPTLSVTTVEATVSPGTSRVQRKGYIFHARIPDGREVDAWSASGFAPQPGKHVVLAEGHHKSGKLSYELVRTVE